MNKLLLIYFESNPSLHSPLADVQVFVAFIYTVLPGERSRPFEAVGMLASRVVLVLRPCSSGRLRRIQTVQQRVELEGFYFVWLEHFEGHEVPVLLLTLDSLAPVDYILLDF